jgi:hypothetical protein
MCLANKVCPVCGRKGKLAKPNWYEMSRKYFNILHQCSNRNCKDFGKAFIYEQFNWHFPDSSKTTYCSEHNVSAEVVEAHRNGLTVECKAQCPVDKKTWCFEIRLFGCC